jgi:hypothetical protein
MPIGERVRLSTKRPACSSSCAPRRHRLDLLDYDRRVGRARRHQRALSVFAFGLLALVSELAGRSLTHRFDVGRRVHSPSYSGADYYPFLLAAVKVGIALLFARLVWRALMARSTERAAERVLSAVGARPRVRVTLSPRLWLAFFCLTSTIYLVQYDAERLATESGRWPLFAPWLHSSALPVFAVLAVLMALAWGAVQRWLAEYERYVAERAEQARRLFRDADVPIRFGPELFAAPPRRLFGLAFESRPPPAPA